MSCPTLQANNPENRGTTVAVVGAGQAEHTALPPAPSSSEGRTRRESLCSVDREYLLFSLLLLQSVYRSSWLLYEDAFKPAAQAGSQPRILFACTEQEHWADTEQLTVYDNAMHIAPTYKWLLLCSDLCLQT